MRALLLVLIAFALSLGGGATANGAIQPSAVIAGWNIWGFNPIPQDRVVRIARVIRRMNPDLIVLSEVNPNDVAERIVQELGSGYERPVILQQKSAVRQNIALIFRSGVIVTNARLIEETDLSEEPGSRKALTANVRIGNFDFIAVGAHLKAGRNKKDREKRTRQAHAIANFISQSVTGSEKDVLVLGDYNMIPRTGNRRYDEVNFFAMSPDNFLRFLSSDFLAGKASHISGCDPFRGNLLDGYAISRKFTREYIPGSTKRVAFSKLGMSCADFRAQVSDHLPLVSEFRMSSDDD